MVAIVSRSRDLAVTGGTGFVGQHLIRIASAEGFEVRALARRDQPTISGVSWIPGSLDDPESLLSLCDGAEAVIHIAGLINGSREAFEAVNRGGTLAMVEAAKTRDVHRFIHISSLSAREPELSSYGWSKALSEDVIKSSGLDWTIIRPPAIYGPGDRETFELFKMARRGFVALPPGGDFSIINVEDLCRLILAAIDAPETIGKTYEPDDGRVGGWDHREFARALGRAFGKRATPLPMPKPVMLVASMVEGAVRGSKAKLTPDRVRYFCHPDWVVDEKLRPSKGLWTPQVETEAGLRQTAAWYLANGWLG